MATAAFSHPALDAFFGTRLTPFPEADLPAVIEHSLAQQPGVTFIGHHNLHSLCLRRDDAQVAAFYSACRYCYVDGVPVLWLLRALGIRAPAARFTLMDCLPALLTAAEQRGWRVCYLGSEPAVAAGAREWIAAYWPRLQTTIIDGYGNDEQALETITRARPDLLLVGMGMPRQECWILTHAARLPPCVVLQAGGTLDYYLGAQAKPPAMVSSLGLGGLYRLFRDPRRLWRRYLLEPWSLALPVLELRRALHRTKAEHEESDPG